MPRTRRDGPQTRTIPYPTTTATATATATAAATASAPSTGPNFAYQRAICFKRWFPTGKPSVRVFLNDKNLVKTYPFDTDDDKVYFVEHMTQSPEDFEEFLTGRHCLQRTYTTVSEVDADGNGYWGGGVALHFHTVSHTDNLVGDVPPDRGDKCHGFDEDDEDIVSFSLTFPVATRQEKLAFAHWIETTRFGDFLQDNTHIHFTSLVSIGDAAGAPKDLAHSALRATADTLFAHKESMPEAAYLAISDAMKRSHETI